MNSTRFIALHEVLKRKPVEVAESGNNMEIFGMHVFDHKKMQQYLSEEAYEHVQESIEKGNRIHRKVADQVAAGMKAWAVKMGATHYTHWFHPLTEGTAEKHDAFITYDNEGEIIEKFSGDLLTQQEPDASSFPSGGLRNTFEARGYTAWDPSSPAFIVDNTLSIPTIFISYTGEALDYKTPLLKSLHLLDKAATEVCQYFDKDVTKVTGIMGWEQEYYLVDDALYAARPDLSLADRTLMGHVSARDQQMVDHYFSSIPSRVYNFMRDFEQQAYRLAVPIKTHHNEVAPNQFEVAPLHEECNLSVDHNLLMMDIMKKIARKHNFRIIFHEKPFKGLNGSGKHNNWSLNTNTGINLLSPGNKPKSNIQFLTFLVNTIRAVYMNQDLFRASVASAGNSERLGGSEAPPSIISVFIGSQLTNILDEIEKRVSNKKMTPDEKTELKLDIGKIPEILIDNTDRNRTSPVTFTGNRFEFRSVGSSANCAAPMIVLNTAVADQLIQFKNSVDLLVNKGVKKDEAIFQVIRKFIIDSKAIRFEGNNYSDEWIKEAEKRGLSNIPNVIDAINAYNSNDSIVLFQKRGIFNRNEVLSRTNVKLDSFSKKINTESKVMSDIAINLIVPTAIAYQSMLIENVIGLKELFSDKKQFDEVATARRELILEISRHVTEIKSKSRELNALRDQALVTEDSLEKARIYADQIRLFVEAIRNHIDQLELIVDDKIWPIPKYRELLFSR